MEQIHLNLQNQNWLAIGTVSSVLYFRIHHLLPQYSVLENVLIPTLAFKPDSDATNQAQELIRRVGLIDRMSHRPGELSGGRTPTRSNCTRTH